MLPLSHNFRCSWADEGHVCQTRHKYGSDWDQDPPSIDACEYAREAGSCSKAESRGGIGQGEDCRQRRLDPEVDGEQLLLKLGKLRSSEGFEADNAANEGLPIMYQIRTSHEIGTASTYLKELGPEQGAISAIMLTSTKMAHC